MMTRAAIADRARIGKERAVMLTIAKSTTAVLLLAALAACATATGAAIGAGIGAAAGDAGRGAAIGAGVGAVIDIID